MKSISSLLLCLVLVTGCAKNPVQAPVPGSINNFDSQAYQILRLAHDTGKSLSAQSCTNNNNAPGCYNYSATEKTAINQFISDVNVADTVYAAYHGGAATQAQAQAAIAKVQTEMANLPIASGVTK